MSEILEVPPLSHEEHLVHEGHDESAHVFLATFIALMVFFFVGAGIVEKFKPAVGHETGTTILLGMLCSYCFWQMYGTSKAKAFTFSHEAFFDFYLPPVIFNSGFNMRKKKFFQNLGNIFIFGLFVTFTCFAIYSVATWYLINHMEFTMTNYYGLEHPEEDIGQNPFPVQVDTMKILLITALLCSSDVVAAVSIVDYSKQPKLFSCIFGEGVVNDIVSIILFNTILSLQSVTFTATTPFVILFQFILLGFVSLTIGLLFGFLTSFIFKHAGFLRVNAVTETFLILALSMLSYFVAEMTELAGIRMSGIISLLTCGIIQSHYTYYNLSPQGKITSTLTIRFLGTAAEAGIYSYIGLSLYSNLSGWWSWDFIIYETIIVIIGRFSAIFICFYTFNLCFKSRTINARELFFIGWGGMIRGAIAFALVLRIPKVGEESCTSADPEKDCYSAQNFDLMVTTTFVLVVFTTLVFGTFMALMGRILVPPQKKDDEEASHHDPNESHHHLIEHPNEVPDLDDTVIEAKEGEVV